MKLEISKFCMKVVLHPDDTLNLSMIATSNLIYQLTKSFSNQNLKKENMDMQEKIEQISIELNASKQEIADIEIKIKTGARNPSTSNGTNELNRDVNGAGNSGDRANLDKNI